MTVAIPTPIYHITHGKNLQSILAAGGLRSYSALHRSGVSYTNIAHDNIQARRARTHVPCGPKGTLHDYVPFYFAPRSPMLYAIRQGRVQDYSDGQRPVLHLVSNAQSVRGAGLPYVFTDGQAAMEVSEFFDDLEALDAIDWSVMPLKYWRDTEEDGDRCRRREAEFLVHGFCPWNLITEIGVLDDRIKTRVEELLEGHQHRPVVSVHRDWYY